MYRRFLTGITLSSCTLVKYESPAPPIVLWASSQRARSMGRRPMASATTWMEL